MCIYTVWPGYHCSFLSIMQSEIFTFENSVESAETANNEPSHQDLHCLPFGFGFWITPLSSTMGMSKIKDWRVYFRNSGVKALMNSTVSTEPIGRQWKPWWYRANVQVIRAFIFYNTHLVCFRAMRAVFIYRRSGLLLPALFSHIVHCMNRLKNAHIEGWAQDWRKSDGYFSPNLISSPWRRYEDYNISFCKQWKFRCHCSYEQWHLNLHCLQRGPSCP